MNTGFLNIPFVVWGGLALLVAGIFAVVVPGAKQVNAAAGWRFIIGRWFHSLVWLLLAVSLFMQATGDIGLQSLAGPVAALAGIAYLIFIITLLSLKSL